MKKVFVQLESGRGYGRDLLKGIHEYNFRYSNWEIIFEPAYYLKNPDTRDIFKLLHMVKPDGCILESINDPKEFIKLKIPIIQASWVSPGGDFPCLKGNYEADGKMAYDYFRSQGFTQLAFFGVEHLEWSSGRLQSFRKHALADGLRMSPYLLKLHNEDLRHDFGSIISWLHSLPKPVGILCCNDDFGQMLINACSIANIKVPNEVAILGVDNDELLCNITFPNLSSLARNHKKAAFDACEILNNLMNGGKTKAEIPLTQPLEIVVRASTDTIASNDTEVIKAIQYIRNNVHLPITVEDVVKATNLSRRTLYTRFKKTINHTINEEIQLQKLIRFKYLLKNQNLSIKEIAFHLGFEDASHVSRWFASLEGISPVKWRSKYF